MQISESTISRDLQYLRQKAKTNIKQYIGERLPEEYEKCLVGLTAILREESQQTEDKREMIQALSLAKECYSMKLELLTNATVVDDAIRFVEEKSGKPRTTNTPTQVENMEKGVQQQIQGNDKSLSTINQTF